MLVRIVNVEDPDQQSDQVCTVCLGIFAWQLVFEIVGHLLLPISVHPWGDRALQYPQFEYTF